VNERRKIRVAVVFGGRSTEHEVSCLGAGLIMGALDRDTYDVTGVGITRDGKWLRLPDDPSALVATGGELPSVDALAARGGAAGVTLAGLAAVDVVLPLLHGPYGEDGTVQGQLEMAGVRYVGAGVLASAVGMDKEYMKLVFAARGLPLGRYVVVRDRDWRQPPGPDAAATERKPVLDEIAELGWPVFVKPARGGSSIGTSRVREEAGIEAAVEAARCHDPKVLRCSKVWPVVHRRPACPARFSSAVARTSMISRPST